MDTKTSINVDIIDHLYNILLHDVRREGLRCMSL